MAKESKKNRYERRRARVRSKVSGTADRPRLSVFRGLKGMFLQLVDDESGKVLVSANSKKDIDGKMDAGERSGKTADAYRLGCKLAQKAIELKISNVAFDRAGYAYHGRVKAAAEGARDGGLDF